MDKDIWTDVPSIKNSLVINAGDYLQLISGNIIKSPIHRVLSPNDEKERLSFVFFFYPSFSAPLANLVKERSYLSTCETSSSECFYNTLVSRDTEVDALFGNYVIKKWMDVFRTNIY